MSLLPFFTWCHNTALSAAIRDSLWLFPVIEGVHLLALTLLGGAVLIVDLRLLGLGLRRHSVAALAGDVRPWLRIAITAIVVTGVLLFMSQARRYYDNPPFTAKMIAFAAVLLFTTTVKARAVRGDAPSGNTHQRIVGAISILLWTTVGLAGRSIGFY